MSKRKYLVFVSFFMALSAQDVSAGIEEGVSALKSGDFQTALVELQPLANAGNPRAQNALGNMYLFGWGVTKDYSAAFSWFKKAAEQGNLSAQVTVAVMYQSGQGVPVNLTEGFNLMKNAAEQGDADAQFYLGNMYAGGLGTSVDAKKSFYWYSAAASNQASFPLVKVKLGDCYYFGYGVEKNLNLAMKYYREAADLGEPAGQLAVANMYYEGIAVPKNYQLAAEMLTKAAEQGYRMAQVNLGFYYTYGIGVPINYSVAMGWYQKALAQGDTKVQRYIDELKRLIAFEQSEKEAQEKILALKRQQDENKAIAMQQRLEQDRQASEERTRNFLGSMGMLLLGIQGFNAGQQSTYQAPATSICTWQKLGYGWIQNCH